RVLFRSASDHRPEKAGQTPDRPLPNGDGLLPQRVGGERGDALGERHRSREPEPLPRLGRVGDHVPHVARPGPPTTSGAGPPIRAASSWASPPTVRGSPEQTFTASKPSASAVRASALAAATSVTCTKSRRCRPSSSTRGGSPRSRAERKIDATPAYGVSRGIRGP